MATVSNRNSTKAVSTRRSAPLSNPTVVTRTNPARQKESTPRANVVVTPRKSTKSNGNVSAKKKRKRSSGVTNTTDGETSGEAEQLNASVDDTEVDRNNASSEIEEHSESITESDERYEKELERKLRAIRNKRIRCGEQRIVTFVEPDMPAVHEFHAVTATGSQLGTFDGTGDLEPFFQRLEDCTRRFRWSEDDRRFFLRGAVRGRALASLRSLSGTAGSDDIIATLRRQYGDTHRIQQVRMEMENRRRAPGESLADLYHDLCQWRSILRSDPGGDHSERFYIIQFAKILNNERFERDLLIKVPANLEQCYEMAMGMESLGLYKDIASTVTQSRRNIHVTERDFGDIPEMKVGTTSTSSSEAVSLPKQSTGDRLEQQLINIQGELTAFREAQQRAAVATYTTVPNFVVHTPGGGQAKRNNQNYRGRGRGHQIRDNNGSRVGKRGPCYRCQGEHLIKECPLQSGMNAMAPAFVPSTPGTGKLLPPEAFDRKVNMIEAETSTRRKAFMNIWFRRNKQRKVLLDSGTEMSVIGRSWVPEYVLKATGVTLELPNGEPMTVLGETDVHFRIGRQRHWARCIVTNAISGFILGIDWLKKTNCSWYFGTNKITINGEEILLQAKDSGDERRTAAESEKVNPQFGEKPSEPSDSTWENLLQEQCSEPTLPGVERDFRLGMRLSGPALIAETERTTLEPTT